MTYWVVVVIMEGKGGGHCIYVFFPRFVVPNHRLLLEGGAIGPIGSANTRSSQGFWRDRGTAVGVGWVDAFCRYRCKILRLVRKSAGGHWLCISGTLSGSLKTC